MYPTSPYSDELSALFVQGRMADLIRRCQAIVAEARLSFGELHPEVATALGYLAKAHFEAGDFEAAIAAKNEASGILESEFGGQSVEYARCCCDLANLYLFTERLAEAELALAEAGAILDNLPAGESRDVARSVQLANLAKCLGKRGDLNAAASLTMDAIRLREEAMGKVHPDCVILFAQLSYIYQRQGKHREARLTLTKGMLIVEVRGQTEQPDYGIMLARLAEMQAEERDFDRAQKNAAEAVAILHRVRPEGHRDIDEGRRHLARVDQLVKANALNGEGNNS